MNYDAEILADIERKGVRSRKLKSVLKPNHKNTPPKPKKTKMWVERDGYDRAPDRAESTVLRHARLQWHSLTTRVVDDLVDLALDKIEADGTGHEIFIW